MINFFELIVILYTGLTLGMFAVLAKRQIEEWWATEKKDLFLTHDR